IKKLCSKAGLIFGLSEQYFADIVFDRASVPEIQGLLSTSTSQRMPKPFPPILFPNLIEDPSLKTVFGNWEPFSKAIRILLWGENGLTALRAGGPLRNGNRWEVTSLTPGLLVWVGVVVSFCVSEESHLMCFCQVVFLLSANKEFRYSGKGEMMKIQYSYMFTSYKKILVKNWNTEYTRDIVKKLNNYVFSRGSRTTNSMSDEEDFTAAMDRALAGV
ncbi:uncharacterized protein EDB93DRAFT_1059645, partial [Suillus bovinus]|uniref:uncharacterized protein n=1 Tax=Suillus bovinus TaxID=48563 RepID=UPI001B871DCD